jgi:sulfur carrier protein ThiS
LDGQHSGEERTEATTVQDVLLKFNRHTDGKIVEVNDEIFADYERLKEVKAEIAKLDEIKTGLEDRIKLGFGAQRLSATGADHSDMESSEAVNEV